MAYTSVSSIIMSERKVQQHSNVRVKKSWSPNKFFYAFDCYAAVDRRIPLGYRTSGQNVKAMYAV
jgi:hypothetical protein